MFGILYKLKIVVRFKSNSTVIEGYPKYQI